MLIRFSEVEKMPPTDYCVIGAGPAGIALSLALTELGCSVLLVESGDEIPAAANIELSRADVRNPQTHAPVELTSCRAFGGTSWWWGGRCVPFDPIDFESRSYAPGTEWPISYSNIQAWHAKAAEFFDLGSGQFEKAPSYWPTASQISINQLERWTSSVNLKSTYLEKVRRSDAVTLLLGATAFEIRLNHSGVRADSITLIGRNKLQRTISFRTLILACGGLETTRLMLCLARNYRTNAYPWDAVLGKFYMGHISGKIADVQLHDPTMVTELDFFAEDNHFARRRFTFGRETLRERQILNTSFWIDNPPFYDHGHESGFLSAVWAVLAIPFIGRRLVSEGVRISHVGPTPFHILPHLRNILKSPLKVLSAACMLLRDRYFSCPRKPGFLVPNTGGRYALHYHAEQLPTDRSRVSLSDEKDSTGTPRLVVDFNFCHADAMSVVRAHDTLDQLLQHADIGHLEYRRNKDDLVSAVLEQASDGFHQIGTTRMSKTPELGVVNENCQVHGIENLFLLSSSVFPSSGQANPTFQLVALAFRLASYLASLAGGIRNSAPPPTPTL